VAEEVTSCSRAFSENQQAEIVELNVCEDHVHLLVLIPPKVSVPNFVGALKGRTAIRVFNMFRKLKTQPYWGNHFWANGYCVDPNGYYVDTVGLCEFKRVLERFRLHNRISSPEAVNSNPRKFIDLKVKMSFCQNVYRL